MIQISAATRGCGWVFRIIARSCATIVALIGHLAVLFALTYEARNDAIVIDPPAAIFVEVMSTPPSTGVLASYRAATIDDRNSVDPINLVQAAPITEQPNGSDSSLVAVAASSPVIALMPARKRLVAAVKTAERQASSAKPRTAPLQIAPEVDSSSGSNSSASGSTATVGMSTAPSDIPSAWKARLLSHLDRYKHFPEAARTRRTEGMALLSFGMDRDGRVLRYYLVRSSGHPELDDEVLAMIERASPLPAVPPEIREQIVQLVVPIRFRL